MPAGFDHVYECGLLRGDPTRHQLRRTERGKGDQGFAVADVEQHRVLLAGRRKVGRLRCDFGGLGQIGVLGQLPVEIERRGEGLGETRIADARADLVYLFECAPIPILAAEEHAEPVDDHKLRVQHAAGECVYWQHADRDAARLAQAVNVGVVVLEKSLIHENAYFDAGFGARGQRIEHWAECHLQAKQVDTIYR